MGIFKKHSEPVFLKESSNAQKELEILKKMFAVSTKNKTEIENRINVIKYGFLIPCHWLFLLFSVFVF